MYFFSLFEIIMEDHVTCIVESKQDNWWEQADRKSNKTSPTSYLKTVENSRKKN